MTGKGLVGMIILFSKGRLGNQLFQLNALIAAKEPSSTALLFGFNQARQVLRIPGSISIGLPEKIHAFLLRILEKKFRVLARSGFLSEISLRKGCQTFEKRAGVLPLWVFNQDWFQGWNFLNNQQESIRFFDSSSIRSDFFSEVAERQKHKNLVFVHVRRGDYLNWPEGVSTSPPVMFFLQQMNHLRRTLRAPYFLVLSDDRPYCVDTFSVSNDTEIVPEMDEIEAFSVMALCEAGILSPSSFSWWAARLASTRASGPWIAPKGWTNWHGHAPGIEVPTAEFLYFAPVVEFE